MGKKHWKKPFCVVSFKLTVSLFSMSSKSKSDLYFENNFMNEAQCIICFQVINGKMKYNIERHFKKCHAPYNLDEITGERRKQLHPLLKSLYFLFSFLSFSYYNFNNITGDPNKKTVKS